MAKIIKGIGYVSMWVIIWGTLGSIIDAPLLKLGLYNPGSFAQASTFIITAIISIFSGWKLYGKIFFRNNE